MESEQESSEKETASHRDVDSFLAEADQSDQSMLAEFIQFLLHNKKWWLAPIIIGLVIFGLLIIFGGSAFAPFIYPFI